MKWNILIATLVTGVGLCTPSFGFELLDRMLGANGCGASQKCCDGKGKDGSKAAQKSGCRHSLFGSRCGKCDGKGGKDGASQKNGKCGHGKDGKNGASQKGCCGRGLFGGCSKCDGKGGKDGASQKNGKCGHGKDGKNGASQKGRCGCGLFGGCSKCDGKGGKDGAGQKGKGCCRSHGASQKDGKCGHGKDGASQKGKGCGCRGGLLSRLFGGCGCDSKGKGGKDGACQKNGAGQKNGCGCGRHHGKGCGADGKGKGKVSAPADPPAADGDAADDATPPAPIVDPSA